jgi:conjugative transfer pilus assembly protein TraH
MLRTKIKPLIVGMSLAFLVAVPAHAGLQEALNDMFMSNVTSAGAYQSQSRGGFVMGSVTARSPIRQVNMFAFDPPRLNAGCGGVDMFGGSFSFINSDQLVTLFRSIASNAVGALFYLAIQKIQPDLSNLMSKFQSLVHALNLGNKNTCAIANSLIKAAFDPSSVSSKAVQEKSMTESVSSAAKSLFSATMDIFSSKGTTSSDAQVAGVSVQSSMYGNLTWRALVRADSKMQYGLMFGGASSVGKLMTMQILQSMIGTQIISDEAGKDKKGTPKLKDATIASVQMFVNGLAEGQVQPLLGCPTGAESNETGCNTIVNKNITQNDWKGVKGVVNEILFGSKEGTSALAGSLVDKIVNCSANTVGSNPCGYTEQQKAFVDQVTIPIVYFVRHAQNNPSMAFSIASSLTPLVANSLSINYLNSVVTVLTQVWSNADDIQMPEQVALNVRAIKNELLNEVNEQHNKMKRLKEADQLLALMIQNNTKIQIYGSR